MADFTKESTVQQQRRDRFIFLSILFAHRYKFITSTLPNTKTLEEYISGSNPKNS